MKPQILGKLPTTQIPKDVRERYKALFLTGPDRRWLGGVDPVGTDPDNKAIKPLIQFADLHGLRPRDAYLYTSICLLPLLGSVGWHVDDGLGHVLCWVIEAIDLAGYKESVEYSDGELLQRHKQLVVRKNDVFIFNASVGHAWLSNKRVLLAQIAVRPQGKRESCEIEEFQC